MTGGAGLAVFDVILVVVGYAWVSALRLTDHSRPISLVGLSFFAGWMVVGVGLALLVAFDADPSIPEVVAVACVSGALGSAARLVLHRERPRQPVSRDPGRLRLVAVGGAVILAIAAGTQAAWAWKSGADSSWDVWAMWEAKGKALYFFHTLDSGTGGATSFAHPDYPPLVPALIAAQYHFMHGPYSGELPFQQSLLSIGFLATLVALLRPRVPGWMLYPCLALLATAPRFWERMQTVLPDQTVAYFIAVAAVVLLLWFDQPRPGYLVFAALSAGAAVLTKNEGLPLALALVACFATTAVVTRVTRPWVAVAPAVGLAAIIPWKLWLARHGLSHVGADYYWRDLFRWGYLDENRGRLGYAARHMIAVPFDSSLWTWVVPLGIGAAVISARRIRGPAVAIAAWVCVVFVGQLCIYWIGRLDVEYYVATSAERVLGTLPVVLGSVTPLLLALALKSAPDDSTSAPKRASDMR